MDEKTYRITLADGTILDNLTMNGNNFISEEAIDASIFDGTCSPVIINDGTNEEVHEHMDLVQVTTVDKSRGLSFGIFRRKNWNRQSSSPTSNISL